jgi:hypothetical protein
MAERPSFDMNKVTTADKILGIGALLLFIDSFLSWQKVCVDIVGQSICASASAWGGNGSFAGVIMALLAFFLMAAVIAGVTGFTLPITIPLSSLISGLTVGTLAFGLIKWLFAVFNHPALGAWLGLILLVVVGYGGYMKMQEQKAVPPAQGFTPPPPGP